MKRSPEFYQRERLNGITYRFAAVMGRIRPFNISAWAVAASEGSLTWNSADSDRMAFDTALGRRKNYHSIRIRQDGDLVTQIYVDGKQLNRVRDYRIYQEGRCQPIVLDVTVDVDWGTVTNRYRIRDLTIITPESFQ